MIIKLIVEGGSMAPGPVLSQKLGPIGINIGQVITKVNEVTKDFEGLKVPVELDINPSTKNFSVKVFSPPVSELLKKEIGITKGSGLQKKEYSGNASIEQIISVAKIKFPNMLSKDLKAALKTVVGTCVSLGLLIENRPASEIEKEIENGKYNHEIKGEITITPQEKKAQLEKYFGDIKAQQEKIKKVEEAAKEAATTAATEAKAKEPVKAEVKTEKKPEVKKK